MNIYPSWPPGGLASIKNYELTTEQITQTLSVNKEIFQGLHLDAVAGYEYMKFTSQGFSLSGVGGRSGFGNYGLDYTNYVQFSDANSRRIASYIDPLSELQSFFGRTIFNYNDRYLLTATLRADGSTKFGANNKYGYFPSFAAGWNINKEQFFKIKWVNSFKLRVGWGETGNQEFPAGSSQALYAFQDNGSVSQLNNPNPYLKWQSDRQYDIGIDFSVFNNRISGTFDYFDKTTTNLLYPNPPIQPAPPNSTVTWKNLDGKIINRGLEVLMNGAVIINKNFGWDISVNTTWLENNVSGLPAPVYTAFIGGPNAPVEIIQNGHPMDVFYTRKFLGLDKSTGFSIYEDEGNTFFYVGDPNPKFLLGISSTFRYKKFSMIVNMNGSFGQNIYNHTLSLLNVSGIKGANIDLSVYQDPVKESFANPVTFSSRYIQNGDYLKMANLTVSYSVGYTGKTFKKANVYVTAQNLFVITKYPGFDPEVNVAAGITAPSLGIDYLRYPPSRSIIFGINFSL
jgi:iron complex outermembrane receptor protein